MLTHRGQEVYTIMRRLVNGGYKLKNPASHFEIFDQRLEANCPFAGGWADMSAQKQPSGYIRVKANLRLGNTSLTVRVDNSHGAFHLDVEKGNKKIEPPQPVCLNPEKLPLLSAFELARSELLKRASELLPAFGSIEQPTLNMLQRLWEAKYSINAVEIEMLLPPYPGSHLDVTVYTRSDSPFRADMQGIDYRSEPFEWEKHK